MPTFRLYFIYLQVIPKSLGNLYQAPRSVFGVLEKCWEGRQDNRMLWLKSGSIYEEANAFGQSPGGCTGSALIHGAGEEAAAILPAKKATLASQKRHSRRFSLNPRPPLETADCNFSNLCLCHFSSPTLHLSAHLPLLPRTTTLPLPPTSLNCISP